MNIEHHHALIFDDSEYGDYQRMAERGVAQARWAAQPFNDLDIATDELSESTDALIAAFKGKLPSSFPGQQLLVRANELEIPRALIVSDDSVLSWINEERGDILILKGKRAHIAEKIKGWLLQLSSVI